MLIFNFDLINSKYEFLRKKEKEKKRPITSTSSKNRKDRYFIFHNYKLTTGHIKSLYGRLSHVLLCLCSPSLLTSNINVKIQRPFNLSGSIDKKDRKSVV